MNYPPICDECMKLLRQDQMYIANGSKLPSMRNDIINFCIKWHDAGYYAPEPAVAIPQQESDSSYAIVFIFLVTVVGGIGFLLGQWLSR